MSYKNAAFSINQYDADGDMIEECILIHIGTTILQMTDIQQLDAFIEQLQQISAEIKQKQN